MDINKLNKVIRSISEKTKNRELLEKILKECGMSRSNCSNLMVYKHGSSFDHYVYRYKEDQFPPEFSYLFLNAAFASLYNKNAKKVRNKKKSWEYVKKNINQLWHNQSLDFFNVISDCTNLDIKKKLIMPALEFHALNLIRLGNLDQSKDYNDDFVESYLRIACSDAFDYIEESDQENFQNELSTQKFKQYEELIKNLRNFYPIIEYLRNFFMKDFLAPNEYKKINIINSKVSNDRYETIVLSKEFLRSELGLSNLNNIFMLNIEDDNMKGNFEINDKVLIKKHPSYINNENNKTLKTSSYRFKNGVYAIKIPDIKLSSSGRAKDQKITEKIVIRRLQFIYPTEHWRDYEVPEFLEKEINKEINKIFDKGLKNVKLYEVDRLINKYGAGNPLLVKKLKPLINLEETQNDYFYGNKIPKQSNHKVVVNIISDDNKYPPISINLDVLPIVGEVLWKSSSYKDKFQDNKNKKFNEPMETKDLFLDENKLDTDKFFDFLYDKTKLKEIA